MGRPFVEKRVEPRERRALFRSKAAFNVSLDSLKVGVGKIDGIAGEDSRHLPLDSPELDLDDPRHRIERLRGGLVELEEPDSLVQKGRAIVLSGTFF